MPFLLCCAWTVYEHFGSLDTAPFYVFEDAVLQFLPLISQLHQFSLFTPIDLKLYYNFATWNLQSLPAPDPSSCYKQQTPSKLSLSVYTFKIHLLVWYDDPCHPWHFFLFWNDLIFVTYLSDICLVLIWQLQLSFAFVWYVFFHPFTFNIFIFKRVSRRYHIVGFCF